MESYDLLLTSATTILPSDKGLTEAVVDIGIRDGKIADVGGSLTGSSKMVVDMKGLLVLPGLIDSQVHMREPGLTHKEDLETGTRGALLGGVTAVFEMPNTTPPTTTRAALDEKFALARGRAHVHHAFFAGASPENVGQLNELETHPSTPGVKVFMGSSTGSLLVEEDAHLEQILRNGRRRVAVHAEDEKRLRERKHLAVEGAHARFHPVWRDEQTALLATQRIVGLAHKTGRPVHILHVTTAEEMDFLKNHKSIASVEVLPQHLTLSAPECYERLGTYAQMNPPIRDIRHQERLWKAIHDRTVDVVASDHAPHTREEKEKPYPQSPSGFPGVQTIVPIMLDHVAQGRLSLIRLVELMAEGPVRVFGARGKGRIQKGYDADFTVVDLGKKRRIENSWIASRCGWTPYDGMTVQGWPVMTILAGQIAMRDDQILVPHSGQPVLFEA